MGKGERERGREWRGGEEKREGWGRRNRERDRGRNQGREGEVRRERMRDE